MSFSRPAASQKNIDNWILYPEVPRLADMQDMATKVIKMEPKIQDQNEFSADLRPILREVNEENLQNKVGELAIEFSKIKVENEGNELFRKLSDCNPRIEKVEKKEENKGHKVFVHYKNDDDYDKPFIVTAENYESIMEDDLFPKYPK